MYTLINKNAALIVTSIDQKHIDDYDFLIANKASCNAIDYQKAFKSFWKLNVARPNADFVASYFELLNQLCGGADFSLQEIALKLYKTPLNSNRTNTLQFSFSTKMLHIIHPKLPIYDSMVRDFYFFKEPNRNWPIKARLEGFINFYDFLIREYHRILKEKLLEETIQLFREQKKPLCFTNEKIVDTIIWSFVACLNKGAIVDRNISYQ